MENNFKNEVKLVPLNFLKVNTGQIDGVPANPRVIKNSDFERLIRSLLVFPKMMTLRPITYAGDGIVLGGNQRREAVAEIVKRGIKKMRAMLETYDEFGAKTKAEREQIIEHWENLILSENPEVPAQDGSHLTTEEMTEFVIKDNLSFGEHDWSKLEKDDWNRERLLNWGVEFPSKKNTEILSTLKFETLYYEPKEKPIVNLAECVNLDKFNAKIKALDEYELTKKQKEILKMFAYRFIKIDFEMVANYYFFNASDEEKKAIERLRLVLTDNGLNGFVEDDLLKIYELIKEDENE